VEALLSKKTMRISPKGVKLIEDSEGFEPEMYHDSAGLPTIGYGTLIDTIEEQYLMTATITKDEALALLLKEMTGMEKQLNVMLSGVDITQNQYDALCSFVYNLGIGALRQSTLFRKLKVNPNDPTIEYEFTRWCHCDGEVLVGLVIRRQKEADLYFSHD
jgi:lysozyme